MFPTYKKKPLRLCTPLMAASTIAFATLAPQVFAQDDEAIVLDTMQIEERTSDTNPYAEAGAPYKAKTSGDSRRVQDLAETPQTITVLTQTAIKESGRTDLKEILASQPGVTIGTGENGNAFGDRYIIRGHEARSDVFVDGLRDPGMTTRESFATEQIEITKGPSSTFAGRGATGGAVNSITKQASSDYSFNTIESGIGTDKASRLTLDSNVKITDDFAVRVNLLHSYKEVPDRGPADKERNGAALSFNYAPTERLDLTADYYYLKAEDTPDLGTYIKPDSFPVSPDDLPVYLQDGDFLDSDVETYTFKVGYQINDGLRIENSSRYGTTDNGYVVTGARGGLRDATDPAGAIDTVTISTHQGWQEVDYFVNQLNFFADANIAGALHQFIIGAEFSDLNVVNGIYDITNNGATNCITPGRGSNPPGGAYCIQDANGNYIDNIGGLMQRSVKKDREDSDYSIQTVSLSLMDVITLNEHWTVSAGLRVDSFDYSNKITSNTLVTTDYKYSDELWNGQLAATYNITENGNIYLSYGTATNINGGESDVGGSCGYGGICTGGVAADVSKAGPEKTENIELGSKWNLLNNKLLLSAAIFQITKDDVMEGTDYATVGSYNTGENRVKGFEIGMVGNITEKFSTQLGLTMMDSEVLKSVDEENIGKPLSDFADDSAFMQLRYQLTEKFAFGGVATYSSELFAGQPDSAAGETYRVPAYTTYDMFASYRFTEQFKAQLNVTNVTDKDYYLAAYRSGAFTYIGDARNAEITLSYDF